MRWFTYALLFVALFTGAAQASDPIGIYANIRKITFEPDDQNPVRARIVGVFALADVPTGLYQPVQRGYLYYTLHPGKEQITRREWADLKSLAGTDLCAGFGARRGDLGTPHRLSSPAPHPDVYPLGMGVVKIPAGNGKCTALRRASFHQ